MRIIAGLAKGRSIQGPGNVEGVRPTSDRVRESLFNVLGQWLDGCRVLDLFAGTGALGLEAWSRGATHVTFVDVDLTWAKKNAETLQAPATFLQLPALKAVEKLKRQGEQFDLAFADPPYALEAAAELVPLLLPLAKTVVFEHGKREKVPEPFDQRRFGDTVISIYKG
ncbi:MAG: RsmD family RNA methyltransferase [Myxococcaceae bacterium]|nr:RsmD family RNA methyltransferase [Myxococcaceae bacterium]